MLPPPHGKEGSSVAVRWTKNARGCGQLELAEGVVDVEMAPVQPSCRPRSGLCSAPGSSNSTRRRNSKTSYFPLSCFPLCYISRVVAFTTTPRGHIDASTRQHRNFVSASLMHALSASRPQTQWFALGSPPKPKTLSAPPRPTDSRLVPFPRLNLKYPPAVRSETRMNIRCDVIKRS